MTGWVLFLTGSVIAVTSGIVTLSPNGGSMLGVMLALVGGWLISRREARNGL